MTAHVSVESWYKGNNSYIRTCYYVTIIAKKLVLCGCICVCVSVWFFLLFFRGNRKEPDTSWLMLTPRNDWPVALHHASQPWRMPFFFFFLFCLVLTDLSLNREGEMKRGKSVWWLMSIGMTLQAFCWISKNLMFRLLDFAVVWRIKAAAENSTVSPSDNFA